MTPKIYFLIPPQPDGAVVRTADSLPCILLIRGLGVDGEDREVAGRYAPGPDGLIVFITADGNVLQESKPGEWKHCYELHGSQKREME